MNKREFFLAAMNANMLTKKAWLLSAFSLAMQTSDVPANLNPYDIIYIQSDDDDIPKIDGVKFIDGDLNEIILSDYEFNSGDPQPPYQLKDTLTLNKGDVANLQKTIKATYGNLVANWLLLVYPFGSKLPYINERFSIKDVESDIERLLVSTPSDDEYEDASKIYVREYKKFQRAAGYITCLAQIAVPSATAKSMTGHPDRKKVKDELLTKYKGQLHNPSILAKIDGELTDLDREWLKDDPSTGFYIKPKSIDVVRKSAYYMMGSSGSFGDTSEESLISNSLADGWDMSKFPAMANAIREGSFDRGAQTALSGAGTKHILRVMQNTKIEEEDCGRKIGFPIMITDQNKKEYVGNYILKHGAPLLITEENVDGFIGKPQTMRSPMFCQTDHAGFCAVCMGKRYGSHPTGLATAASSIGTVTMMVFMSSMHGKALKVAKYNFKESLR